MAINIDYSASPSTVLNAAYMAGKNKHQREQQAAMLPFVRDQQQFQRQAYLYDLAWQHQQQLVGLRRGGRGNVLDAGVPEGGADPKKPLGANGMPLTPAQRFSNQGAQRAGKPLPFPLLPATRPKTIEEQRLDEDRKQHGVQNQFREGELDVQRGRLAVEKGKAAVEKGKEDANAIPPAPDFSAPAAGEDGPDGGHPVEIRGGKPVSMTDSSGYFGSMASADYSGYGSQPLATTGLVGSALTGYDGHYQTMANDLMQQWGQSGGNQQPPLEQSSPYLQFDENQYDQSAYYA